MTIGIDIDDTLVKTNKRALEILRRENSTEDVSYYEDLLDLPSFIQNHFKEIVHTAELFDGAKETIDTLKKEGHRIILVTSRAFQRGADTEQDTIEFLNENGIEYDKIYLRMPDKLDVCLREKIDVFIDDKEKTLKPLKKAGIRCLKMLSHETGPSEFKTVSSWQEILSLLTDEKNRRDPGMEFFYYQDKILLDKDALNHERNLLALDRLGMNSHKHFRKAGIDLPNPTFFYKRNQKGASVLGIQVLEGDIEDLSNYLVYDCQSEVYENSVFCNIDFHSSSEASTKAIEFAFLAANDVTEFFRSVEQLLLKSGETSMEFDDMMRIQLQKKDKTTIGKIFEKIRKEIEKKD